MRTPLPTTLVGRFVRLEPLDATHAADLDAAAAEDPATFAYMSQSPLDDGGAGRYIAETLTMAEDGSQVPFAIIDLASGRAIGSSRLGDIATEHGRLEIGWTWIAASARGGAVNAELKLLMLGHAFEQLGCTRVALKTDLRNERSQRAIAGLGAVREGVLRDHMVARDGYLRSTVMFSVLREEWPGVRDGLEARVAALLPG